MKNLLIFLVSFFALLLPDYIYAGCSDSAADMMIRPANHPNACVAIELENLSSHTGDRLWQFDPAVGGVPIDADTGLPLTPNPYPLPQGATKIVYWTTPSDKRFRYNGGSWERFHNCNCNPIAADLFEDAPLICNTSFYCGTTSSAYGVDQTGPLECNGGADHSGSLENNSWLRFIAASNTASFNINVLSGCYIQFAVYAYNPSAPDNGKYVLLTDIDWTNIDDGFTGAQTIVATGLTPGNEYYLHFDGHGGAECNYEIGFNSGFAVADLIASDNLVCVGDAVTLTATPNDPSALYSWTINGGAPFIAGSTLNVNPTVNTTYEVSIVLTGCDDTPQAVVVNMDACTVLPVELTNFNIECEKDATVLSWQTVSEHNNDFFALEKASNDLEFRTIATVDGAGNSNTTQHYTVEDTEKTVGDVYYRIRQVDFNGTVSYSDVLSSGACSSDGFKITSMKYMQSTNEIVIDYVAVKTTSIGLKLVDLMGRPYLSENTILEPNTNQIRIKANELAGNAMYILNVSSENTSDTERIYVNH